MNRKDALLKSKVKLAVRWDGYRPMYWDGVKCFKMRPYMVLNPDKYEGYEDWKNSEDFDVNDTQ